MKRAGPLLLALACARGEPQPADCLELPAAAMDLGFEAPFALRVRPACVAGPVSWKQVAGPAVALAVAPPDGLVASGRTLSLAAALGAAPPWGVVPLSPRTRGELVFLARWRTPGGRAVEREARLAAAARSRGLPNVAVGARVHLGGQGWTLAAAPAGSAVRNVAGGFVPDRSGDWRLLDSEGRALLLHSGRYDETPLDCGRSGCHAGIAAASAGSRMTTVLARGLDGAGRDARYPQCALDCHATGEPQLADGGFTHVAGELGLAPATLERWASTPRALRRLGGVGCLACHGPGAIPEASARWSILRSDVCATCHDAPPRYGHVEAWRRTRMATADRDPRTRDGACARCHTTAGFLAAVGAPPRERRAPDLAGALGVGCAACHAVHATAPATAPAPALLRDVAAPAELGALPPAARKSSACIACHTPGEGARPFSSAAAIWLGRGGLDPRTARPLEGPAPHAAVAGGCLACHRGGPDGLERGASHGFAAAPAVCATCHGPRPAGGDIRTRAARLAAMHLAAPAQPPHAAGPALTWNPQWVPDLQRWDSGGKAASVPTRLDRATARGRAAWNVTLVLEDPAASAHNPAYARRLLDAAEEALR